MSRCPFSTRRGFLGASGGALAAPLLTKAGKAAVPGMTAAPASDMSDGGAIPFFGKHQAGIATPQQTHLVFASFDIIAQSQSDLVRLLQDWTQAAAIMAAGDLVEPADGNASKPPTDSGTVRGLGPGRLTLTFGFGPGLFEKDGKDRYGLAAKRPAALVDLPRFNGDQLEPAYTGGDLCIQACADDSAVAFHAIRQLAHMAAPNDAADGYGGKKAGATLAYNAKPGVATLRWLQTGFLPDYPAGETPRNLFGFKDGTENPGRPDPAEISHGKTIGNGSLGEAVWVGNEGPVWMQGGSYLVVRRIRMALQHWDNTALDFQESIFGRKKVSGGPLTGGGEFTPLNLDATDADGNPVIAENSHVRLGAASTNDGARILRRAYSYNDGLKMIAERWPPWRQGLEYEAGLIFVAFQRDPRTGFIKIFDRMSKFDMMNQFTTHTGSAIFACPSGIAKGGFIGADLFT
ncbi:Dyp-type peroxidase [Acidocella aminolytica]|uniref:DyP-type peroxidase n=1 Tax=Acidocella aminolytica 101 = DSM 11237 TaxID=1120923 RepID=A0A0D6PCM8_9PROT|nr:Dyp-type peroxidase [Acidocella aminolytica]GAN79525.1 DyP-type peroxidase [Acidocella aminolytica 101 = DSM 11237]GBQ32650.1 putative iron-dependent peroxidase [Acidocella aminolytica 101 = DSM 11237]SHF34486.1 deferrochelatase/peroxidase EfeB [Acidocella aminolytica 101 = DSM 11237]